MADVAPMNLQERYIAERPKYDKLANLVGRTAKESARELGLSCRVSCRAKEVKSFMAKALARKGGDPYNEIRDKAGVRIVADLPWALCGLENLVQTSFCVLESDDKRSVTPPDKFVYRATHFQVTHPAAPIQLKGLECEIQVLTKAESLWADTTHDLIYKPSVSFTDGTERTFHRLMSLMELFDLEVSRAYEEMSTLERSPQAQLLHILEPHHRRLVGVEYNGELSDLVLGFFAERIISEQIEDIKLRLDWFVRENSGKLERLFSRYRNDDHANPLIWQPEIFVILFQLESDSFVLQALWPEILPIDLLVSLSEDWGKPISLG